MRYWYDTEFNEDGSTIDLLSIGIVAEDGREYYAVNADADWPRVLQNDWLMENVAPSLPGVFGPPERNETGGWDWGLATCVPMVKSKATIRDEVTAFIRPGSRPRNPMLPVRAGSTPELWAWFGAYDHVALAQLFGRMVDMPPWIPMFTNDLRQEQHRLGNPPLPAQPTGLHNALADARFNRVRHEALTKLARTHITV
ncbi:hypothetical protein GS982_20120 [Rhodococcus hoagii]|nr:hypothetical protein [Prescottella equi]NKZ84510.1 hypothetical protein [Prescottella equi]